MGAFIGNRISIPASGGQSWSPANLNLNTVGRYVYGDGSSKYVTKDGSNYVSVWKDLSGKNHHLLQATGTQQPLWTVDGVLFDGVDNFMKTEAFTLDHPFMYYLVLKQVAWENGGYIVTGNTNDKGLLYQSGITPNVKMHNGSDSAPIPLTIGNLKIVTAVFNGASSRFMVNNVQKATGNFGTANMGGITLGRNLGSELFYPNILFAEAIFRNVIDTAENELAIYTYLAKKYPII